MTLETIAQEIAKLLSDRSEKIVLAESCTCGLIASQLGRIPGISANLCGSAVVYRADTKRKWLGVSKHSIIKHTTESAVVAQQIASGVLKKTPEANWSIGVVGHIGVDVAKDKAGIIYISFCRRTKKGKIKVKEVLEHKLSGKNRIDRQKESVEVALTYFVRLLNKKNSFEKQTKNHV